MSEIDPAGLWAVIAGMTAVTYIPRALPLLALRTDRLPSRLVRMLRNVPFAVLGALIFPGILDVGSHIMYGIIGGLVAAALALLDIHLVLAVAGAIAAVTLSVQLF